MFIFSSRNVVFGSVVGLGVWLGRNVRLLLCSVHLFDLVCALFSDLCAFGCAFVCSLMVLGPVGLVVHSTVSGSSMELSRCC